MTSSAVYRYSGVRFRGNAQTEAGEWKRPHFLKTKSYEKRRKRISSKVAENMGYVDGVEVECLFVGNKDIITGGFFVNKYGLWIECKTYNVLIMKDGKWAEIINTDVDNHIKALTDLGYVVTVEKKENNK